MSFDRETVAARIRAKRAERDISQADLADEINIAVESVCRYEQGLYLPSAENIVALAQALGTTPNYLLGWDDS